MAEIASRAPVRPHLRRAGFLKIQLLATTSTASAVESATTSLLSIRHWADALVRRTSRRTGGLRSSLAWLHHRPCSGDRLSTGREGEHAGVGTARELPVRSRSARLLLVAIKSLRAQIPCVDGSTIGR